MRRYIVPEGEIHQWEVGAAGIFSAITGLEDKKIIKVITEYPTVGKVHFIKNVPEYLLEEGTDDRRQIISIFFESMSMRNSGCQITLYRYIKERILPEKMTILFWTRCRMSGIFRES